MTNPLRIFGSKIFWSIYEPMSSEFWVKLTGNKKIKEIKEALKLFCERPSTLEIGAAEGYITRCLAKEGRISKGTAYDLSSLRIEKGRKRADREGLGSKVKFVIGDAKSLPFKADKYSVVMLLDVLEHIPKKEDVIRSLKEAYRVASKGMIISIPQNDSNDWVMRYSIHMDPDHLRVLMLHHNSWIYKPKSFQSMLKQLGYRYERMPQNNSIYLIKKTN